MGSYVVSIADGDSELSGTVHDLETGRVRHFTDAGALVAALSAEPCVPYEGLASVPGEETMRRRRPAL